MSRHSADLTTAEERAGTVRNRTTGTALPDFALRAAGEFAAAAGLVIDAADGTFVRGHIDLGADHHTPWGIVNGGVYTTAVESAATVGASLAVAGNGQRAVALHISTDLLRSRTEGRAEVIAEPVHQGRTQQIWAVTISDERPLARGQIRLQNVDLDRGPA
ncbi:PaaI family thioesterase [Streptomyces sp. NPDC050161]|uniref:PaaI family thioesterase n=1 Tax=Streptomyces sp. NPDC050161 TaxID=3365604 RepID=UPI0037958730